MSSGRNRKYQNISQRSFRPLKKVREQTSTITSLEGILYEVKPLIYLGITISALRILPIIQSSIKLAALGVISFSVYVILSRLSYRGYI